MCQYNTGEGNPNDVAMALTYIDTMSRYIAPRLVLAMGLGETTSVDNTLKPSLEFEAFPNPASTTIQLQAKAEIQAVQLFDVSGKMVLQNNSINHTHYQLPVQQLAEGIYFAKIRFEQGVISEKLIIE